MCIQITIRAFFISLQTVPQRQSDSVAPSAASVRTIQNRCTDDPAAQRRGEEPDTGAHGHSGRDGSLRL